MPLKPLVVIRKIRSVFPENTIICHEHGLLDNWAYPHFPVLSAGACLTGAGHTCMGLGVVGAISAKLSFPERDVISVTGDGAFQMYAKEMATSMQYHAPVTYCVLNSFSLDWMKFDQELAYGNRHIGVDFDAQPEFVKLAEAYGCSGETVNRAIHVEGALERALQANRNGRTAVIDFRVDPRSITEGFHEYYSNR
jgi:acetolactate synthase-1/2/3 large subunit